MSVFNNFPRQGDVTKKASYIVAMNNTGATVNAGEIGSLVPSTQKIGAVTSTAITKQYPLLVCLDPTIANGAYGRWAYSGEVLAKVTNSLAVDLQVMPTTVSSGGSTLIQFATDSKGANKSCGFTMETGTGSPTRVLFDGESGRTGGYSEAS